ncbi:MAG TPA: capsular biosynthesis protein [Xanthobacteraceae bacterium]|nr:capsular biosynthesis protein [Xanthobacteraceae bacterium]
MDGDPHPTRRYLFLQGLATRFFACLGVALAKRGHSVKRINFTAGDRLFWELSGSVAYRGTIAEWPWFFEARLAEWRITDIVLFGDCRPLHAIAIGIAARRGVSVHVFDEGYLRPNWITMERQGANNNSLLPRDPDWYRQTATFLPAWNGAPDVASSFRARAIQDVVYHLWSLAFVWRYPGYRSYRPCHPVREGVGWLRRFVHTPILRQRNKAALEELAASGKPYYVVPLQLDSDSQIRIHSSFGHVAPALSMILRSFARHAPTDAVLVLKEHPLDSHLNDWRALSLKEAASLGFAHRLFYVTEAPLELLLRGSRGVVTVNSTVGLLALSFGVPAVTLGKAIYDMPGLTFRNGLDRFWREATAPDFALFDAFRRVVAYRTQIYGGFFSASALALAVAGTVERLETAALEQAQPLILRRAAHARLEAAEALMLEAPVV